MGFVFGRLEESVVRVLGARGIAHVEGGRPSGLRFTTRMMQRNGSALQGTLAALHESGGRARRQAHSLSIIIPACCTRVLSAPPLPPCTACAGLAWPLCVCRCLRVCTAAWLPPQARGAAQHPRLLRPPAGLFQTLGRRGAARAHTYARTHAHERHVISIVAQPAPAPAAACCLAACTVQRSVLSSPPPPLRFHFLIPAASPHLAPAPPWTQGFIKPMYNNLIVSSDPHELIAKMRAFTRESL